MELTDAERAEFTRLANATLDPDLWDESDLPLLRKVKEDYEKEQARKRSDVLPLYDEDDSPDDEEHDSGSSYTE